MNTSFDYKKLIEDFLHRNITVKQFEELYIHHWAKSDLGKFEDVLETLFYDVDAYTDLPIETLKNPSEFIDEDELRVRAQKTLDKLEKLEWK